jgi:hypothetical protein
MNQSLGQADSASGSSTANRSRFSAISFAAQATTSASVFAPAASAWRTTSAGLRSNCG